MFSGPVQLNKVLGPCGSDKVHLGLEVYLPCVYSTWEMHVCVCHIKKKVLPNPFLDNDKMVNGPPLIHVMWLSFLKFNPFFSFPQVNLIPRCTPSTFTSQCMQKVRWLCTYRFSFRCVFALYDVQTASDTFRSAGVQWRCVCLFVYYYTL